MGEKAKQLSANKSLHQKCPKHKMLGFQTNYRSKQFIPRIQQIKIIKSTNNKFFRDFHDLKNSYPVHAIPIRKRNIQKAPGFGNQINSSGDDGPVHRLPVR